MPRKSQKSTRSPAEEFGDKNKPKRRRNAKDPEKDVLSDKEIEAKSSVADLEKMLKTKNAPTDIKEIANRFHQAVGGSEGFVKMVLKELDDSPPGSLARMRIYHLISKLFEIATPKDRLADLALITDKDLERVWDEQLAKSPVLPQQKQASLLHNVTFTWDSLL